MTKKLLILACMLSLMCGVNSQPVKALYHWNNTSGTTQESLVDPGGEPLISFPANPANYPAHVISGLLMTYGTYVDIPADFAGGTMPFITGGMWILYIQGILGEFARIGFTSGSYGTSTIVMTGQGSGGAQHVDWMCGGIKYATQGYLIVGWNYIGAGGGSRVFKRLCNDVYCALYGYMVTNSPINFNLGTGPYHIGCKDCTDTSVKYILHSFKIMYGVYMAHAPASNFAPYNSFLECGKGTRDIGEQCDDKNIMDGDGCDINCTIEPGWMCTGGTSTTRDYCTDICGDGKRFTRPCDDGNLDNLDGCSNTCTLEPGFTCTVGTPSSPTTCTENCGDGMKFNSISTYCDDNNTVDGDGCSSTCVTETGWACSGGNSTTQDICTDICGDGLKFTLPCDDGNLVDKDGCSSNCTVDNGWECSGGTISGPDTCERLEDEAVQTMSTASQGAMGDGAATSVLISSTNSFSLSALWAMANQLQLFCLLIVAKVYLPHKVIQYISSNSFAMSIFSVVPFSSLWVVKSATDWLEVAQPDESLEKIGMSSKTTFNNNIEFLLTLISVGLIHLGMICVPKCKPTANSGKPKRIYHFVVTKIWNALTFGIYIRMGIEAYAFILLSAANEYYYYDESSKSKGVSVIITLVFICCCVGLIGLSIYKYTKPQLRCLGEFTHGLQEKRGGQLYVSMFLIRRALLVCWVVCSKHVDAQYIVLGMTIAQVVYMAILGYMRPFQDVQANLVEFTNEIFYFVCVFPLLYLASEDKWTGFATEVYLYVLLGNNLAVCAISMICGFIACIKKIVKKLKGKGKQVEPKTRGSPSQSQVEDSKDMKDGREENKHSEFNNSNMRMGSELRFYDL